MTHRGPQFRNNCLSYLFRASCFDLGTCYNGDRNGGYKKEQVTEHVELLQFSCRMNMYEIIVSNR